MVRWLQQEQTLKIETIAQKRLEEALGPWYTHMPLLATSRLEYHACVCSSVLQKQPVNECISALVLWYLCRNVDAVVWGQRGTTRLAPVAGSYDVPDTSTTSTVHQLELFIRMLTVCDYKDICRIVCEFQFVLECGGVDSYDLVGCTIFL